jgi:hypothetical protein
MGREWARVSGRGLGFGPVEYQSTRVLPFPRLALPPAVAEVRCAPRLFSTTSSPAMAATVAAVVTARLPPRIHAPWLRRGHVSSLGRPLAVLRVVAASRRSPGDGGKKRRRRATEADQEDGLSVSSGKPSPRSASSKRPSLRLRA